MQILITISILMDSIYWQMRGFIQEDAIQKYFEILMFNK